jgi:hypothetical protein
LAEPGCLLSREKGREEGGEVRGGAIGVNPVLEPFPDDILPEGLVHVNPPKGESDCCETAAVVVVVWVWPSLGEVKGERRGGGWMETGEDV